MYYYHININTFSQPWQTKADRFDKPMYNIIYELIVP